MTTKDITVNPYSIRGFRNTLAAAGVNIPGVFLVEDGWRATHLVDPTEADFVAARAEFNAREKKPTDEPLTDADVENIINSKAQNHASARALAERGLNQEMVRKAKSTWIDIQNDDKMTASEKAQTIAGIVGGEPMSNVARRKVTSTKKATKPATKKTEEKAPKAPTQKPAAPIVPTSGLDANLIAAMEAEGLTEAQQLNVVKRLMGIVVKKSA